MAKEIELQNGMKAIVDDEDFERVNQFNWTVSQANEIAISVVRDSNGEKQILSRFVLGIEDNDCFVVHINKVSLDFRKSNLKVLSRKEKNYSSRGKRNTSSKYKGVCWNKQSKSWVTQIQAGGKPIYLGSRKSEDEAALLYNEAAKKYFGENAYQNILGQDNSATCVDLPKRELSKRTKKQKKTKFRGVCVKGNRFQAKIKSSIYLGSYKTEIEAAEAYNKAAIEIFGDKAILNDLEGMQ